MGHRDDFEEFTREDRVAERVRELLATNRPIDLPQLATELELSEASLRRRWAELMIDFSQRMQNTAS